MLISFSFLGFTPIVNAQIDKVTDNQVIIDEIVNSIQFPNYVKSSHYDEYVMVDLVVKSDGTITIIGENHSNEKLSNYVITKLKKLKLKHFDNEKAQVLSIKFHYKN